MAGVMTSRPPLNRTARRSPLCKGSSGASTQIKKVVCSRSHLRGATSAMILFTTGAGGGSTRWIVDGGCLTEDRQSTATGDARNSWLVSSSPKTAAHVLRSVSMADDWSSALWRSASRLLDDARPGLPWQNAAIVDQGQRRPLVDELVGPPVELRVVRVVRVRRGHSRRTVHAEPHVVLAHAITVAAARPAVAVGPEASADPSVEEVARAGRRPVRRGAGRLEVQAAGVG